ncbi:hypothetical protein ABW21_db0208459 [Orbilia brochopaga]|nr:hypothetical protein ABW21_db0208459 [Drechslerella brochopaga]
MSSSSPDLNKAIPILMVGKHVEIGKHVKEQLLPDYDVIHVCLSLEDVKTDVPGILRGEFVTPASNIGSNKDRPRDAQRLPQLLSVGGGFSAEDFDEMQSSVDLTAGGRLSGDEVPVWLKRNPEAKSALQLPGGQITPEFAKFISDSLRKKLDEASKEKGLK